MSAFSSRNVPVASLDDDEQQSIADIADDASNEGESAAASSGTSTARPRTAAAESAGQNIKVMCRFRPENAQELREGGAADTFVDFTSADSVAVTLEGKASSYTFDRVFPPETTQQDVYDAIGRDTVSSILEGFNAAVLSYGQTGSGQHLPQRCINVQMVARGGWQTFAHSICLRLLLLTMCRQVRAQTKLTTALNRRRSHPYSL